MNDNALDLHPNTNALLSNPPQPSASRGMRFSLLNPSSIAVRQNLSREMRRNINDSINYNITLILFSLGKVIASIVVLSTTDSSCNKPFREWLVYLMMHDLGYISLLALKVKTITRNSFIRSRQEDEANAEEGEEGESIGRDIFGYRINNEDSVFSISEDAERKNRLVSALTAVCKTYYYAVFVYAQILYFHISPDAGCPDHTLLNLVIVYIMFGYIFIGMPVLFIVLACLCLPFLLFFSYLFSRGEQVPVPKDILKNIPVMTFSPELPGTHECSICMVEYVEGDKLIQLKCSPMHHFHEECLKKWLKINGLCPICRARIEDSNNAAPRAAVDLELANTNPNPAQCEIKNRDIVF